MPHTHRKVEHADMVPLRHKTAARPSRCTCHPATPEFHRPNKAPNCTLVQNTFYLEQLAPSPPEAFPETRVTPCILCSLDPCIWNLAGGFVTAPLFPHSHSLECGSRMLCCYIFLYFPSWLFFCTIYTTLVNTIRLLDHCRTWICLVNLCKPKTKEIKKSWSERPRGNVYALFFYFRYIQHLSNDSLIFLSHHVEKSLFYSTVKTDFR